MDPDRPVLVDKYLDRADELDVDALCDKHGNVVICGIMQHIEQAGVHSGQSLAAAYSALAIISSVSSANHFELLRSHMATPSGCSLSPSKHMLALKPPPESKAC